MEHLRNDENNKRQYLRLLIEMARADKEYKPNEDMLLKEIAERMHIDVEEVEELKKEDETKSLKVNLPKSEPERMTLFYQLLFMMRIDGNITAGEKRLCKRMGFRLGINPLLVDELIDIMVKHLHDRIPENEMLQSIKKYLN